ncbi:helix-hairpin-helix domain-containing protein [Streptomyces sp. NPDC005017]|uniref:helix-hairpin-helix domain-containing protein n=1 Tax=Streptomyces sp. NPDC005017 TaxID=3364706 RepID=UPI0036C89C37
MALRSHPCTPSATSGPGRGPSSDGRVRHRRRPTRARHGSHSADELRRRAASLFAEPPAGRVETGAGPPRAVQSRPRAGSPEAGDELPASEEVGPVPMPVPDPVSARDDSEVARRPGPGADYGDLLRRRAGLALRERMPVWLQSRCGLERRSVVALAVVLVVAAGLAGQHFWSGRTQPVAAPEVVREADSYVEERTDSTAAEPGPSSSEGGARAGAPPAEIVVDVSGKVREPGIHRLPAGSRVADALQAAGGVRPGTKLDSLNRARFLVDGEQVVVGGPAGAAPGGMMGGAVPGAVPPAGPAAPVSLGTATVEQLDGLPGVGPVLAQHIIDYRTQHGGFRTVDELREVNGIGERRFADLRNLVRP